MYLNTYVCKYVRSLCSQKSNTHWTGVSEGDNAVVLTWYLVLWHFKEVKTCKQPSRVNYAHICLRACTGPAIVIINVRKGWGIWSENCLNYNPQTIIYKLNWYCLVIHQRCVIENRSRVI